MRSPKQQLQKELRAAMKAGDEALALLFTKYLFVGPYDWGVIMNRKTRAARELMRRVGIRGSKMSCPDGPQKRGAWFATQKVANPELDSMDLENDKELLTAFKTNSIKHLSQTLNKPLSTTADKLERMGCNTSKHVEVNPCCNKEWLVEHYVRRRLSRNICCNLAGVSTSTFATWLAKFQVSRYR